MRFIRVNSRNKCRICGHADWCGVSEDGNVAACMRVMSEKQAKNGAYLHFTDGEIKPPAKPVSIKTRVLTPTVIRTSAEINEIYAAFLDHLVLAKNHETDLRRRGLGSVSIDLHGYKSMPPMRFITEICRRLSGNFDLRGVPGFYTRGGIWHFVDYRQATGFLIPIRNRKHEICALTLRRDAEQKPKYQIISSPWQPNGTSSGTPPHFATLGKICRREDIKSVVITEGVLKANVASELSNQPIVGLVSVTTFNESLPVQLKETFPLLREVKIAFDMDALTNEAVAAQRNRLCETLRAANLKPTILTWNSAFKGIDDYLLSTRVKSNKQRIAA